MCVCVSGVACIECEGNEFCVFIGFSRYGVAQVFSIVYLRMGALSLLCVCVCLCLWMPLLDDGIAAWEENIERWPHRKVPGWCELKTFDRFVDYMTVCIKCSPDACHAHENPIHQIMMTCLAQSSLSVRDRRNKRDKTRGIYCSTCIDQKTYSRKTFGISGRPSRTLCPLNGQTIGHIIELGPRECRCERYKTFNFPPERSTDRRTA